jgi:hypothetical protein
MKIAICTPYHGDVTAQYAESLVGMVLFTSQCQFEFNGEAAAADLQMFMRTSSLVPQARAWLVDDAIGWGADYLLWIDADHSFPADALFRLLSLNKAVVGANYPRRVRPTYPTALDAAGNLVWTTEEKAAAGEVEEVGFLGLGFCLVSTPVIQTLKAKGKPLFTLAMTPDHKFVGEDHYFCELVQRAGFAIHVDHALSWKIGHVARQELYNQDAIADRGLAP